MEMTEMAPEMTKDEYNKILNMIEMADSPVGIDAKKTHVIIIHKLQAIEQRLAKLEEKN